MVVFEVLGIGKPAKCLQIPVLLLTLHLHGQFLAVDPKVVVVPFAFAEPAELGSAFEAFEDLVDVLVRIHLSGEVAPLAAEG